MKTFLSSLLAFALVCSAAPSSFGEPPHQVLPGTPVRLTLLSYVSTASSRDGDPFVAVVAEPVSLGDQLLIPAGTRVNGIVRAVSPPRRFSVLRGQPYVSLTFRSLEIESRLIPIQMSVLSIEQPGGPTGGKQRKDIKIAEGQVVQGKHDYKGDVVAATVGVGGGTLAGAVFSHAVRGFGIGMAGSAAYVVACKGKDVEIPAQSSLLVRVDNTVTVPVARSSYASSALH